MIVTVIATKATGIMIVTESPSSRVHLTSYHFSAVFFLDSTAVPPLINNNIRFVRQ